MQRFPDAARKHVQLLPFLFCPNTVGFTKGLHAFPFSLSGMEQKELCSWLWVWLRGSMCVCIYIWEVGWCVPCGWTTDFCAEQYMAYRGGVREVGVVGPEEAVSDPYL